MSDNVIRINNIDVLPGERSNIKLDISTLPSGTNIFVEAHVFRAYDPGPTVLLVGGVHGDEINGIQIVRKAIEYRKFENLKCGSVIAIPLLNVFGFINFSRDVPDGKDVNRSFPGTLKGSLASRVARAMTKEILPNANYLMDFHTGGSSRYNLPQIRYSVLDKRARDIAKVFSPPVILQKGMIPNSFRKTAFEMGIPAIVYEGGESVRLDGYSIDRGYEGMLRVLQHLALVEYAPIEKEEPLHFTKTSWIRAPKSGLFMWTKKSGNYIVKGEPVGLIKDPQGSSSDRVLANRNGYIIGHNNTSVVHVGDALFHIAYDKK